MAKLSRLRKRIARKQARKYKKMTDQERYERMMAAKARRNASSTTKKKSDLPKANMEAVTVTAKKITPQEKAEAASKMIKKKKSIFKENERIAANKKAEAKAKPGGTYVKTMKDGTKKKVKAIKKAEKGASLKAVPKENKGLSKLPTSVRNKMGYAQKGGVVKGGVDPKRAKELMDVMKKSSVEVRNVGELPFDSDPSNPAGLLNYVNSKLSNKIQAGNAAEINFVKKYRESMLKGEGRTDSPKMKHGGKVGNPPKKKMGYMKTMKKLPKMGYKKTVKTLKKKK